MNARIIKRLTRAVLAAATGAMLQNGAFAAENGHVAECSESGTYEITEAGTDFVLSGEIGGDVAVTLPENCRVTLSGVALSGTLAINGDAELWLVGDNAISTAGSSAISCSGALTLGGDGTLAASAAGAKKTGVVSASSLTVSGGTTVLTISNPTAKNACGVSLSGDYMQTGGALKIVGTSGDYKQNGVFLSKKNTKATIAGGTLDVTLAGEKSVGLAMDKATVAGTMTGGTLKFTMSGDGAKGVKGDGSFTMTGGTLEATLAGGVAEDYFEYEDGDGNTWNYYVTLTSSTKTSGGTSTYNTSSLIANGTYPVMDPSKCYAVKVGTLAISGGTVKVTATGTAGRGLGADNMTLSGGFYDITVSGGPTDVYVESLVESDDLDDTTYANGVTTCLDSGGAACLKTSGTDSILTISGGTFNLKATGDAGKLVNAAGYLVIGTEGQKTLPTDVSFSPDISGSTTGSKVYCTAVKQKYYGVLAVATATTDIGALMLSVASDNLVKATGAASQASQAFGAPGGQGGPGGVPPGEMPGGGGAPGGGDDNSDYSNPKGIKGYSGVTIHGGRLAITTKNDGGEGLESKNGLTINGGVIDLQCYDDCINSGGDLYINGGYIYSLATGNDSIDSNGNIYMTGGVVLAFSTAGAPEVGIDTDNSNGFLISGGHLVAVGGASGNMIVGSSGTQKTYKNASVSASTYSGKYLSMTGTDTFTVKMPTLSGSISLVCTTEGWTSASTPTTSSLAPTSGSLDFHDAYLDSYVGRSTTGASLDTAIAFSFTSSVVAYPVMLVDEWIEEDERYDSSHGVLFCRSSVARGGFYTIALPSGQDFEVSCAASGAAVEYLTFGGLRFCIVDARDVSSETAEVLLSLSGSVGARTMVYVVAGDFLTKRLSFDPNGGTCEEKSREVRAGQPVGELPVPDARAGHAFAGWFTTAEGGARVTGDTIMVLSDVTLYAHWDSVAAGSCEGTAVAFPFTPSVAAYAVALAREWLDDDERYDDASGVLYCKSSVARGKVYTLALPVGQAFEVSCGDAGAVVEYASDGTLRYCRVDARNLAADSAELSLSLSGAVGTRTTVYVVEGDYVPAGAVFDDPPAGGFPGSCPGKAQELPFGASVQAKSVSLVGEWDEVGEGYLDGGVYYLSATATEDGRLTVAVPAAQADGFEVWCNDVAVASREAYAGFTFCIFDAKAGDKVLVRLSGARGAAVVVYTFGGDFLARRLVFDPNGGSCAEESKDVRIGQPVGELPVPVRVGRYVFKGWSVLRDSDAFVSPATVMVAYDVTLYARWEELAWGSCQEAAISFSVTSALAAYPVSLVREWLEDELKYSDERGTLYCKTTLSRGTVYTIALPAGTAFEVWCENGEASVTYGEDDSLRYCRIDTRNMMADETAAYLQIEGDPGARTTVYAIELDYPAAGSCAANALRVVPSRSVGVASGALHPEWSDHGYREDGGVRRYYVTLNPGDVCTFAYPAGTKCAIEPDYGGELGDIFRTAESGGLVYALVDLRNVNLAESLRVDICLSGEVGASAVFYHVLGDYMPAH